MSGRKKPTASGFPSLQEIQSNPLVPKEGEDLSAPLILAFDLSSSAVGWALGRDGELLRFGKLVFKTTAEKGESWDAFEEFLAVLFATFSPDIVLAERPSSRAAETTRLHNEMAGILRKSVYQVLGREMDKDDFVHPQTIKAAMLVPAGREHDRNKVIMLNKINKLYWLGLRWDADSKYESDDDIADAIAVLTTYWRRNSKKEAA